MNIILFGPYGSGKGTQAKIIAEKYHLQYFETGGEIRKHIAQKTPLGKAIKEVVESGHLISGEQVMEIVNDFINNADFSRGILFDGVPRTFEQQKLFDDLLRRKEIDVQRILIDIPKELSLARQIGRKSCQNCKAIYPAEYKSSICEKCGFVMQARNDQNEIIARKRIEVYEKEVRPVIQYYLDRGEMITVDGTKPALEVTKEILKFLQ